MRVFLCYKPKNAYIISPQHNGSLDDVLYRHPIKYVAVDIKTTMLCPFGACGHYYMCATIDDLSDFS